MSSWVFLVVFISLSDNSCHLDSVMPVWHPCNAWFHGVIYNRARGLWLKLEFLDKADQEEKQLCPGQALPRAHSLANLEWNHPLIPSGQPNTVSVLYWPKIWAKIVSVFSVSEIRSFGDSAKLTFLTKTPLFCQKSTVSAETSLNWLKQVFGQNRVNDIF